MNQNELIARLREPFKANEIEWKLQRTTNDKTRGLAVAYIDSRAIQKRLDEVVGVFNWRNEYTPWQTNAQLCGIAIYHEDRKEWIIKHDGSESPEFESTKGGLSNAFRRAAVTWGIGRFLYEIDGVWVDVEQRGKSSAIKDDQYPKLESEYNKAVAKIFGTAPPAQSAPPAAPSYTPPQQQVSPPSSASDEPPMPPERRSPNEEEASAPAEVTYQVKAIKPSGKSSQLVEMIDISSGELLTAYVQKSDQSIKAGACLRSVQLERKTSTYGDYNLLSSYQLAA